MNFDINKKDNEFKKIAYPILINEEFLKTKDIMHHGMNRYEHSLRVAYYSYRLSKALGLSYIETTRAALMHDFFLNNNEDNKATILVRHPKYALDNASNYFSLTDKEKDIIKTHMFPITFEPPKYLESWLVDFIDDGVSIFERVYNIKKRTIAVGNVVLIILLNIFK